MIPQFTELGNLPAGVHLATLDEIADRFGRGSEVREVQLESVRWMVELARKAGIARIVLNGSFVTDIIEPNDVDCVLLIAENATPQRSAMTALRKGLPFLEIAIVRSVVFQEYVNRIFAADRAGTSKGMLEIIQWN